MVGRPISDQKPSAEEIRAVQEILNELDRIYKRGVLSENVRLRREVAELRAVLERVKWYYEASGLAYCSCCGVRRGNPEGHTSDCRLAAILARTALNEKK